MANAARICRLHIEVADIAPPIWREIELSTVMTLTALHGVIQALMGWHDYHLWAFWQGRQRFEPADPDEGVKPGPGADPALLTIGDLLPRKGATLRYNYDFGDDWWLEIKLLSVEDPQPKVRYPHCLAGERAGPPEDWPARIRGIAGGSQETPQQAVQRVACLGRSGLGPGTIRSGVDQ